MNESAEPGSLFWLPVPPADWRASLDRALVDDPEGRLLRGVCSARLDISQLRRVATRLSTAQAAGAGLSALRSLRLSLVGAGTLDFLADALPGTAPRFGLRVEVAPVEYNAFATAAFAVPDAPVDVVAITPDADSFVRPAVLLDAEAHRAALDAAVDTLRRIVAAWRTRHACEVVLATIPLDPESLVGGADRLLYGGKRRFTIDLNTRIADLCEREGVALWDIEVEAAAIGAHSWRDPVSLHVAKSPFAIRLAPLVADRLCALLAGLAGKSRRVLVLDLDNTCWGGVIGDDGLAGIVVGQGDVDGEAFLSLQRYALELRRRGIVLCVCSKNEDAIAREPFREHPDMLLREEHFAVFQANWSDKATNLKSIAEQLSLNADALVFVDDNPAERARVRQLLPEVAVPELPDDPAWFTACLAAGRYFENSRLNAEDVTRAEAYRGNAERAAIRETLGDYDAYLRSLVMVLTARRFDANGRARIAQLINKSNQFNLTTRRRSEAEVAAIEMSPDHLGLQFRLVDAFGDNGMISVAILRFEGTNAVIDTWLMSCRVLERQVEQAVLNSLAGAARERGAARLIGQFIPTPRNAMVAGHYAKFGFAQLGDCDESGMTCWELNLVDYCPFEVQLEVCA